MKRFFRKLLLRLGILLALCLAALLIFRILCKDTLRELAQTQVKNATSDMANDALTQLLEQNAIAYDRIVYFEKDLDGKITAMKTNILEVNRLKASILALINALRNMTQIEGKLLLTGISPQPMRVFRASGLDKLVEIREAVS